MSSLTSKEKLRALGLKAASVQNNPYQDVFEQIEAAKDYSTFSSDVNNQSSFSEFETYLTDTIGVGGSQAADFRRRMEQKYSTFSDFQNALSGFSSYDEWINSFSWGTTIAGDTTDGDGATSGIRIHGEDGLSYDGIKVPKGTLEAFGPRLEFSQTAAPIDATASFSAANLTVSNTTPSPNETIQISADITNNSGYGLSHTVKYTEDGNVVKTRTLDFAANETRTVSFERTYDDYVSYDVSIDGTGPTTVTVVPDELTTY